MKCISQNLFSHPVSALRPPTTITITNRKPASAPLLLQIRIHNQTNWCILKDVALSSAVVKKLSTMMIKK
ncbi:hypothetical protein QVD17_11645 [Tagetes erecta]|uniref:Uncharacterized protein n=1 Tax=Tagetes erecta TaxID=13708 RepID=A0AAD8P2D2_TARER|nr:hypothetical protein QVD17_11645 [Tagetes erecta]